MSDKINILSIDFDYFQNIPDKNILYSYPDGHDLCTELSMFMWSNVYAYKKTADRIKSVGINQSDLQAVEEIIDTANPYTPNWIVNSHIHMYDVVKTARNEHPDADIHVYNMDLHHDCFGHSKQLGCGNWVLHVIQDFNVSVTWIANPTGLELCDIPEILKDSTVTSIQDLDTKTFDFIFLCRSDVWLPPHLDSYFEELRQHMINSFVTSNIDNQVNKPRNMQPLVEEMHKISKMQKGMTLCQPKI